MFGRNKADDELDIEVGLEGWREMAVCVDDDGLFLRGNYQGEFRERESAEATCETANMFSTTGTMIFGADEKKPKHRAPHDDCDCGYYALTLPDLNLQPVTVLVSAAGRTIKTVKGWRTARFRIEEIYTPQDELVEPLREQFGVPVFKKEELLWRLVRKLKLSAPSPSPTS